MSPAQAWRSLEHGSYKGPEASPQGRGCRLEGRAWPRLFLVPAPVNCPRGVSWEQQKSTPFTPGLQGSPGKFSLNKAHRAPCWLLFQEEPLQM